MGRSFCSISSVTRAVILIYVIWDSPERDGLTLIFPFSYWQRKRGNSETKGERRRPGAPGYLNIIYVYYISFFFLCNYKT